MRPENGHVYSYHNGSRGAYRVVSKVTATYHGYLIERFDSDAGWIVTDPCPFDYLSNARRCAESMKEKIATSISN